MLAQFTDLDELCLKVRSQFVKNYIVEAITAYRAGAYRAAIVTVWVAVCVDIIEKISDMSIDKDTKASVLKKTFDGIGENDTAAMLRFEASLLDYAHKDLELISVGEMEHLERIRSDRHICVHPSFHTGGDQITISPEQARNHIVSACQHLLIHAPTKGKNFVDKIFMIIKENSFPKEINAAYKVLSSDTYLGKAKPALIRNLLIVLIKHIFKDDDGVDQDLFYRITASIQAIARINNATYTNVMREKIPVMLSDATDKRFSRIYPFITVSNELWAFLDDAGKTRAIELIKTSGVAEINLFLIPKAAITMPGGETAIKERVALLKEKEQLRVIETSAMSIFKEIATNVFVNSGSFDAAYTNGAKYLLPHAKYLDSDDLTNLFVGVIENGGRKINQILNASDIDEIFTQLFDDTKGNVRDHSRIWQSFWSDVISRGHYYPSLEQKLISAGIVEQPAPSSDDDETPF